VSRDPAEILRDALAHFEIMQTHAERDLDDRLVIDAVCMRLSAGIEALAALDPNVREEIFGEAWPLMWGMRNRIAHGYLLVDAAIIQQTVSQDVPSIMSRIRVRLEHGPSAAISDDYATAGEPAHADMPSDDTGRSARPSESGEIDCG